MTNELTAEECRLRYQDRLRADLKDLADESQQTDEDRKPVILDQQSVGRLSRMDALQGQAMAQAMQSRRDGRSRAVIATLDRLETGEFGWCDECGEFIGVKRLDLNPTATRCVECAR